MLIDYVQNTLTDILNGPTFPFVSINQECNGKICENKIDNPIKIDGIVYGCNTKEKVDQLERAINKRSLLRHDRGYIVAHGCVWFFDRAS